MSKGEYPNIAKLAKFADWLVGLVYSFITLGIWLLLVLVIAWLVLR